MLLVFGPQCLLYRGPPVDGEPHRHHALQLAASLGAPLWLQAGGATTTADGFAVAADTPHRLAGGAPSLALLYLEAESAAARAVRAALPAPAAPLAIDAALREQLSALDGRAPEPALHAGFDACIASWLATTGAGAPHTATTLDTLVADTLAHLDAYRGATGGAAALATRVHLSPDRLMHLFARDTGTSLRAYALWAKLRAALRQALAGESLTAAAHAAGFADSAHFSHSFRAMFGLPPRFLFERRSDLLVRFR